MYYKIISLHLIYYTLLYIIIILSIAEYLNFLKIGNDEIFSFVLIVLWNILDLQKCIEKQKGKGEGISQKGK